MALPQWVQQTRTGSLPPGPPAPTPAAPGGAGPNYQLPLAMQHQLNTNWCWAAVSVSVALFQSSSPAWQQCQVACQELGLPTCCGTPTPAACDATWYLEKALARVGHLNTWAAGFAGAGQIRTELANNLPVGCRIGWSAGGGHFVAVSGIAGTASGDDVTVDDPFYGRSVMPLATFQSDYRAAGSWTHTYYTN